MGRGRAVASRRAHNPEVAGPNPATATEKASRRIRRPEITTKVSLAFVFSGLPSPHTALLLQLLWFCGVLIAIMEVSRCSIEAWGAQGCRSVRYVWAV